MRKKPVGPANEIIKGISALGELFKRKEKKQPRRLYIPEEHVREVLEAYDAWDPCKAVSCYDFWKLLSEIFPEVAEEGRLWKLDRRKPLHPYLEEKLDK